MTDLKIIEAKVKKILNNNGLDFDSEEVDNVAQALSIMAETLQLIADDNKYMNLFGGPVPTARQGLSAAARMLQRSE